MGPGNSESGIRFVYNDSELAITRNGETIISAEQLYSLVFDLLVVNCFLPEDWPPIRQSFSTDRKRFEISIGAESVSQVPVEIIDDERYINQGRQGEFFLESVINPEKFLQILRNKLVFMGLRDGQDFTLCYNEKLGRITVALQEE